MFNLSRLALIALALALAIALAAGPGAFAQAALKGLGFSVSLVTDGDYPGMSRAIRDFGNAIKRPDAVALKLVPPGHAV